MLHIFSSLFVFQEWPIEAGPGRAATRVNRDNYSDLPRPASQGMLRNFGTTTPVTEDHGSVLM